MIRERLVVLLDKSINSNDYFDPKSTKFHMAFYYLNSSQQRDNLAELSHLPITPTHNNTHQQQISQMFITDQHDH
ncbi:hypothetical protein quinque_008823 [Culex quinquefasciatus]